MATGSVRQTLSASLSEEDNVSVAVVDGPLAPPCVLAKQRLASYDGIYTMKMDVKHNRWIVSIYDAQGSNIYTDVKSDFHGQFNVYWIWDHNNRLWLYSSDDSFVYYWAKNPNGWIKICWSSESDMNIHRFYLPKSLYPNYE